jgi:hypothetical protein
MRGGADLAELNFYSDGAREFASLVVFFEVAFETPLAEILVLPLIVLPDISPRIETGRK